MAASLVNSDAASLLALGLRNADVEDAVVEASRDGVLVDAGWEVEGALELAEGPLRDPEFLGGLGLLLLLLLLGRGSPLVLNGGLVGSVFLASLGDGVGLLSALDQVGGRIAGRVGALDVAADGQGLRLGKFDLDILTFEAGKLAVKFIGVLSLVQVELRIDDAGLAAAAGGVGDGVALLTLELAREVIEVAKQTEEGGEAGVRVVETAREESHFVVVWGVYVQMGCLEQSCRRMLSAFDDCFVVRVQRC